MELFHHVTEDTDFISEGLSGMKLMEHRDEAGISVFTSRAWRKMLDIRGSLVHEFILEFFNFLGTSPLYTLIRDPILRLCHRLIACSIAGRKRAHISGGQFVARLAKPFGLLTAEILGGLTIIAPELPIIDMTDLPVVAAGAPAVAEDAPIIDEGGQADLAPEQAPHQPPPPSPAAARTIPQRLGRLEEDV
ncbi:hypothetical protein Tco_0335232 [Tanacetum coccineum]